MEYFFKPGGKGNNAPAVNGPHLDYYQNMTALNDFVGNFYTDSYNMTGLEDLQADFYNADLILGVWRPVGMKNPVYDYPLIYMDAQTFNPELQVRFEQEFSHISPYGEQSVKNLAAHMHYDSKQKWYFHKEVDGRKEAILFTHFTKARPFDNFHSAIKQQDLPVGMDTRMSIENRIALHFS